MMIDTQALVTVLDWVRFGCSQFRAAGLSVGQGTNSLWDDALALVLHALHLEHTDPAELMQSRVTSEEAQMILKSFHQRLKKHIPVAYLTNRAVFSGLSFYVDERVLIPRSPIAECIENHFAPWIASPESVERIVDIGTGSGCIAIACAYAFPAALIDAVDNSTDALAVAEKNVLAHGVQDHVMLHHVDILTEPFFQGKRYNVIVSNPPYVSEEEYQQLPEEFFQEPQSALIAKDEGLSFVLKIFQEAGSALTENGILVMEVGNTRVALERRFPDFPGVWIDFERGGEGVFVLTAKQLKALAPQIEL